tara:strand:- start:4492 stop:5136 length:645 start_codon:yes stop_codon:yes gene_type:complete
MSSVSIVNSSIPVSVTFPTTQDISGSVSVLNWPTVQDVSGSVNVLNFPAVQDVSGSVSVLNFPAVQDVSGSVSVLNWPAVQDVSGSVVLGASNNIIGKVYTFENSSLVKSLTNLGNTGQTIKASAGSLFNLTVFDDGNAVSYVKIYNKAIPTASDTPVFTLPILHDTPLITISCHNVLFDTAIGVRATALYAANDTTAPNGVTSLTAFYNGFTP